MSNAVSNPELRTMLARYLVASRRLRAAASRGDLERAHRALARRGELLERLRGMPVTPGDEPTVARVLRAAERAARRAGVLLRAIGEALHGELGALAGERRRGAAFGTRHEPRRDAGYWLDLTS